MEERVPIRDIPGYEVSSNGDVYSTKRNIVMKQHPDSWGYPRITLMKNGVKLRRSVHRLVAEAFIPNPSNKPEINHIDGNKNNNHINNLEWVTHSENIRHSYDTGLNDKKLYNSGKPKKRVMLLETNEIFESIHDCAKRLGCTHVAVLRCVQEKSKTCMGYHITY